jgi:signal transduction histidine kinase
VVGAVVIAVTTLVRRSRRQLAASLWREQKARAIAEAADRTKDDCFALVSHELQTPLSVVLGWIAAIGQRRLTTDGVDHALDAIARNTQILSRLVDKNFRLGARRRIAGRRSTTLRAAMAARAATAC